MAAVHIELLPEEKAELDQLDEEVTAVLQTRWMRRAEIMEKYGLPNGFIWGNEVLTGRS